VKRECKFCKCQNYARQKCIKEDGDSKSVRQDVEVPHEGDIVKVGKTKVQVNED